MIATMLLNTHILLQSPEVVLDLGQRPASRLGQTRIHAGGAGQRHGGVEREEPVVAPQELHLGIQLQGDEAEQVGQAGSDSASWAPYSGGEHLSDHGPG